MERILHTRRYGQALMVSIVLVTALSLTVILGATNPVLRHRLNVASFSASKNASFVAEAGVEDAMYRLKRNMPLSPTESLTIGNDTAITTISTNGDSKIIQSENQTGLGRRKYEVEVQTDEGVSFSYALQAGNGGFDISGGARVNGNVYANGNIVGAGNPTIAGAATAANSAATTTIVANMSPIPPTQFIDFGKTNAQQDIAQSFEVSEEAVMNSAKFYLKKTSTPGDVTARLATDLNGKPDQTLSSITIPAANVSNVYGWVTAVFPGYVRLDPDETYWLVLDVGTNSSRYYTAAIANGYSQGVSKIGAGTTWNNVSAGDMYVQVFAGGILSSITGIVVQNGDAWANSIRNSSVSAGKTLYCKTGSNNGGKLCNTSRSDPTPGAFPISESQIEGWKTAFEEEVGSSGQIYTGNLAIGWQGTTTAIRKINGNLSVNGGGTAVFGPLEVTGNIDISGGGKLLGGPFIVGGNVNLGNERIRMMGGSWIKGDLSIASGAVMGLDPSMGGASGTILVDGIINIQGGGQFQGSGQSGSYPIVISTNNCNGTNCNGANAISASGGAGSVVLFAPYGTLIMNGGTSAKAMTAYKIVLSGGGTVTYESGLADITLSTSPSGTWNVSYWKEIE